MAAVNHIIKAHDIDQKERTKDVLVDNNLTFNSLMLSPLILEGLSSCGYRKPSPIQQRAIPIGKCGFDLIIKSKSGTGKTAVFTIIALEMLDMTKLSLQSLILTPTREIAVQIKDVIKSIGCKMKDLSVETFIGGLPLEHDMKRTNCHIAVGAPGRIRHLIEKKALKTNNIRLLIFDEADKLMENAFAGDIEAIYNSLPIRKQVIASSATYPDDLDEFLQSYMSVPTHVSPSIDTPLLLGLQQFASVLKCSKNVLKMMNTKTTELNRILSIVPFAQCLVFSNSQIRVETISNNLNRFGWKSMFISAGMSQSKRLEIMKDVRDFKCRILLSTDLTARGIDIDHVDLVINYELPLDICTYLHRMGRAGRFGSRGIVISMVSENDELPKLKHILAEIGLDLSINLLPTDELNSEMFRNSQTTFEQIKAEHMLDAEKNTEIIDSVLEIKENKRKKRKKKKKEGTNRELPENDLSDSYKTENSEVRNISIEEHGHIDDIDIDLSSKSEVEQVLNDDPLDLIKALASNPAEIETHNVELSGMNDPKMAFDLKNLIPDNLKQIRPTGGNNCEQMSTKENQSDAPDDSTIKEQVTESVHTTDTDTERVLDANIRMSVSPGEESKKRKRNECRVQSKQQLFEKNVSLLHVTKLLIGAFNNCEIPQEVVTHVKVLLDQMNAFEAEMRQRYPNVDIDNLDQYAALNEQPINSDKTIENILQISYDYSTNAAMLHWGIFMEKQEKQASKKCKRNNRAKRANHGRMEDDTTYEEPLEHDGDYDCDQENQEENLIADEEYENYEYPTEEDLNHDYNATMNDHFMNIYEQHKRKLTDFMENCSNAAEFNEFFKYWQEQLKASTDYVQQNLYLEVMNNYRYYKQYN